MSFCNRVSAAVSASICAVALALTPEARATDVGGPITSDTTWTLAGSPYVAISTVTIRNGATLTIEAGVEVRFNQDLGIIIGHVSEGLGTLRALGTTLSPVLFTSAIEPGAPGSWKEIRFTNNAVDAVFDAQGSYAAGSVLQHCAVKFAGGGPAGSGAITIVDSAPFITACEVAHAAQTGIYVVGSTPAPLLKIAGCNVHDNVSTTQFGGGASINWVSDLLFSGNTIENNSSSGVGQLEPGVFYYNDYYGNAGGGLFAKLTGGVTGQTISGNAFIGNSSTGYGGGAYVAVANPGNPVSIIGNTIAQNDASAGGGLTIWNRTAGFPVLVSGNVIANNSSSIGGGCYLRIGAPSVGGIDTVFDSNVMHQNAATSSGGALAVDILSWGCCFSTNGTVSCIKNVFSSNTAGGAQGQGGRGGAVSLQFSGDASCDFVGNDFIGNHAIDSATDSGRGGAAYFSKIDYAVISLEGDPGAGTFNSFVGNFATFGDAIFNNSLYRRSLTSDIHAEYVCWGGENPSPVVDQNLIWDLYDDQTRSEVIYGDIVVGPQCGGGCDSGEILDCNGNCAPASWVGDGICDDGAYAYGGTPISFDCEQFGFDGGDCANPPPPTPGAHAPPQPPSYPPSSPPSLTEDKLILITHGWNTAPEDIKSFWEPLRDAIDASVGADWKVELYDWHNRSGGLSVWEGPNWALGMAVNEGYYKGAKIKNQNYKHVHFIAHSAGAALIAAASYKLRPTAETSLPTIHMTFLDAYAGPLVVGGVTDYKEAYGGKADWADHYFARDLLTGLFTQLVLPQAYNVDVTLLDPAIPGLPGLFPSSHGWPTCFYRHTVDLDGASCGGAPSGAILGKGFPLAFEECEGCSTTDWITSRNASFPHGSLFEYSGFADSSGSDLVFRTRESASYNLLLSNPTVSQTGAVGVESNLASLMVNESGQTAWINLTVTTTEAVNFLAFEGSFPSAPGGNGVATVYVDGYERGYLDEAFAPPGSIAYRFDTPGELTPGTHVISVRLDQFGPAPSSVNVASLATGWGGFVNIADLNVDGIVNGADLGVLLGSWGACTECPADTDGDGVVGGADLGILLGNWGAGS